MKKTLLLAGVACLFSANVAQAMDNPHFSPVIGLDYAYSDADFKRQARELNNDFSSGIISVGTKIDHFTSVEAYWQMAGEEKTTRNSNKYKAKFSSYGIDAYGHMPIGCAQTFELLGSLGLGIYDVNVKKNEAKTSTDKVGYRFGLGAQYNFNDHWAGRLMGRYNYIGNGPIHSFNEFTAGVRYTF